MEKKRAVILFADIQGSTRFGYTQDVEPYNEMVRDYHRTARAAVEEYCQKYGLDRARLTCSVRGDECCMFITGGGLGEDEEHALRLAVYLKEWWKQSDFVVRIQEAAETRLYPLVDLRIGIGSGEVACDRDCWTREDTFEGIRISEAKRIEGMADDAAETLIMVNWEVRDACQKAGLDVQFGEGRKLVGKGIPNWLNLPVYPVTKYGDWANVHQAVPKAPGKPDWASLFEEGWALVNSGQYDRAIAVFGRTLKTHAHVPFLWYGLGFALREKGDYPAAIHSYRKAVQLLPHYRDVWWGLGNAYDDNREYDQAIKAYRKALQQSPSEAGIWHNLGIAYYHKEDYGRAIQSLRKSLEVRPDHASTLYDLGLSCFRCDRTQGLRIYEVADKLNPEPAQQAYSWACLYSQMGDEPSALIHLRRAIELGPKHRVEARADPDFDPIRHMPAFRRLVATADKK